MNLVRSIFRFFRPAGVWRWGRVIGAALVGVCALLTLTGLFVPAVAPPSPLSDAVADPVVTALRADPTVFTWGDNAQAPEAFVFEDPDCLFCERFNKAAAPFVASGRLRLRVVLVAFLKSESAGRAAAIWHAPSPSAALMRNTDGFHALSEEGGIAPVAPSAADAAALRRHLDLLRRVGPVMTPTLLFRQGGAWMVASGFQPGMFERIAAPGRIPQPTLPTVTLRLGGSPVAAEVADTARSREIGLMGRGALAPDHGMLFVSGAPRRTCFWMKDTRIALSIAFMDASGRILNTGEMRPETLDSHCSTGPATYALEMPRGWFAAHGVAPGSRVSGLPSPQARAR